MNKNKEEKASDENLSKYADELKGEVRERYIQKISTCYQ
jgi:hypothetical protein